MSLNVFDAKFIGTCTNEIEFVMETSSPVKLFVKVKSFYIAYKNLILLIMKLFLQLISLLILVTGFFVGLRLLTYSL